MAEGKEQQPTPSAEDIALAAFVRGLSRKQLALKAGIPLHRCWRILRGDSPARPEELLSLAKAAGLELVDGPEGKVGAN